MNKPNEPQGSEDQQQHFTTPQNPSSDYSKDGKQVQKRSKTHLLAVLLFGIVVPLFLLLGAYKSLTVLQQDIVSKTELASIVNETTEYRKENGLNGNDYAYLSFVLATQSNEKTMVNKQVLKILVIQVGFAVISLGVMLLVLGINQGGIEGSSQVEGYTFDITVGSSGVAVFLIGAIMVVIGGVLKNTYQTVGLPKYIQTVPLGHLSHSLGVISSNPVATTCEESVTSQFPDLKIDSPEYEEKLRDCRGPSTGDK